MWKKKSGAKKKKRKKRKVMQKVEKKGNMGPLHTKEIKYAVSCWLWYVDQWSHHTQDL